MNFKSISRKLLSVLVVLTMVLPMVVSAAFAADAADTVRLSSTSVTLGESVTITVSLPGKTIETQTAIKANGVTIKNIYGDYYEFDYTPETSGIYVIIAGSADAELTVAANGAPVVDLGSYSDGDDVRTQLLAGESLTATATDDGEIVKMEIKVDGNVFKSAEDDEISVSYSEIGLGTFEIEAVAYDDYGLAGSAGVTAVILNEQQSAPTYVGETKESFGAFRNGPDQADKRFAGFASLDKLEDGNTVLAMGKDERCDANQTNNDYSMVDVNVSTYINQGGVFSLEFDLNYAKPKGKSGNVITFAMREQLTSGANIPNIFRVRTTDANDHVIQLDAKNPGDVDYPIEPGEWYHVRMYFDWMNNKIDVYAGPVGGEETMMTDDAPIGLQGNGGKPNLLRLYTELGKNTADQYATVYFDNFVCSTVHTPPNILSITEKAEAEGEEDTEDDAEGDSSEAVSDEIPYTATALTATVNTVPVKNSVTTDTVYLLDAAGNKVVPKSVELDVANFAINIELEKALDPGASYSLVFDKTMKMTSELAFGADVKKSFTTSKAGCYDEDVEWYYSGENAVCQATIRNGGAEAMTVYAVYSSWSDTGFLKTEAVELTLDPGPNPITHTFEGAKSGDADMYILSDLSEPFIYTNISK